MCKGRTGPSWRRCIVSALAFRRMVGFETVIDVAFVGNLGRHLLQAQQPEHASLRQRFLASSQDPTNPGKPLPDSFPGARTLASGPLTTASLSALRTTMRSRSRRTGDFRTGWNSSRISPGPNPWTTVHPTMVLWPVYASRKLLAYGVSSFDRTYIVNLAWLYELPVGQHLKNSFAKTTVGGTGMSQGQPLSPAALPQASSFSTTRRR